MENARNVRILAYGAAAAMMFLSGGIAVRCTNKSQPEMSQLQVCGSVCGAGKMKSYSPEACFWDGPNDTKRCRPETCECQLSVMASVPVQQLDGGL